MVVHDVVLELYFCPYHMLAQFEHVGHKSVQRPLGDAPRHFESLEGAKDERMTDPPTPAGFEPAPPKENRFLICRRNHLAIAP